MNQENDRPLTTSDFVTPTDRRSGMAATAPDPRTDQAQANGRETPANANTPTAAQSPNNSPTNRDDPSAPLFAPESAQELRSRWATIQTGFVDEPRQTVEQADTLVAEVIQQLASSFADEKSQLERQWERGADVSTEDLRQALRRYRSFFDRLLSV